MWFRKNVAGPERWARFIFGLTLTGCGLIGFNASLFGLLVACVGVVSLLTAFIGYCPACALVGRKPHVEQ